MNDQPNGSGRAGAYWAQLTRAALAVEPGREVPGDLTAPALAAAVDRRNQSSEYNDAVAESLVRLAIVLQQEVGPARDEIRERAARLILSFRPDTLRGLMTFGGDQHRRREFLIDAAASFEAEPIARLTLAAGSAAGIRIPLPMIALLRKLALQSSAANEQLRAHSAAAVREIVNELIQVWWPIDTSSSGSGLEDWYARAGAARTRAGSEDAVAPGPERVIQLSLEIGAAGVPLLTAIEQMIKQGRLSELLVLVRERQDTPAGQQILLQLAAPSRLRMVLRQEPVDFDAVDRILAAQNGGEQLRTLLDELAESESRATRRGIFDRLAALPADAIGPLAAERLRDNRWFVQRNVLALLAQVGYGPDDLKMEPLIGHADVRVRKEAARLLMKIPRPSGEAVIAALRDADPHVVRFALQAAKRSWNEGIATVLAKRLGEASFPDDARPAALRLLRGCGSRLCLEVLLRHAYGGKTLLGKPKLAGPSPETTAAVEVLAHSWAADPIAERLLAQARESSDAELRRAATGDA